MAKTSEASIQTSDISETSLSKQQAQVTHDDKIVERDCPSCGTDNSDEEIMAYSSPQWPMKKCKNCGLVYLEKAWSLDILYEKFAWEKSVEVENKRRNEIRGVERTISKKTRKRLGLFPRKNISNILAQYAQHGNVVDIGSGSGHYLLQLPEKFVPYGVEISTKLANTSKAAIQERGGDIVNKDALSGLKDFEDNFLTGIMMRSFLEHDITPKETLIEAYRALKSGGIVVIKVPNYAAVNRVIMGSKWCGFRFPEHVNYFTPKTLKDIIEKAGFEILRFNLTDKLPTGDNMWCIAVKR